VGFTRRRGGAADEWLRRAEARADPAIMVELRRLADEVTAADQALAGVDPGKLARRAARLRQEAATSVGARHDVTGRAARAAEEQLRTVERLVEQRRLVLARMESAVLGLESEERNLPVTGDAPAGRGLSPWRTSDTGKQD
jgi:uncharacterized membrane protein YccC